MSTSTLIATLKRRLRGKQLAGSDEPPQATPTHNDTASQEPGAHPSAPGPESVTERWKRQVEADARNRLKTRIQGGGSNR